MTVEETTKIVDKVKAFRQSFSIYPNLYREWHNVLQNYEYEDVDKKLDEYLKDGDNFGKYPDAYYLVKYLQTIDDKQRVGTNYVSCQFCGKNIELALFDEHYDRCSSVDYVCRMSEKHFNKKLSAEKLREMDKKEFEKNYWNFCDKLYDILPDDIHKHTLKNAILTHHGYEPELTVSEILGGQDV